MKRAELLKECVRLQIEKMRIQNAEKFGNNDCDRHNEDSKKWYKLFSTYPVKSGCNYGYNLTDIYNKLTA